MGAVGRPERPESWSTFSEVGLRGWGVGSGALPTAAPLHTTVPPPPSQDAGFFAGIFVDLCAQAAVNNLPKESQDQLAAVQALVKNSSSVFDELAKALQRPRGRRGIGERAGRAPRPNILMSACRPPRRSPR